MPYSPPYGDATDCLHAGPWPEPAPADPLINAWSCAAQALGPLQAALCQVPGGAGMISVPGAGHNLRVEAPAAVQVAIRGFLQQQ